MTRSDPDRIACKCATLKMPGANIKSGSYPYNITSSLMFRCTTEAHLQSDHVIATKCSYRPREAKCRRLAHQQRKDKLVADTRSKELGVAVVTERPILHAGHEYQ